MSVSQDRFSFLVSLSSSIKRRMIERPSLPSLSTCDKDSAKCGLRYLPGCLGFAREDGRGAPFLKNVLTWGAFERVEPRRGEKKKVRRRIDGCTRDRSNDRLTRARAREETTSSICRRLSRRRRYKIGAPEHYTYAPPLRDAVGEQPPTVTDTATNAYENASESDRRPDCRETISPAVLNRGAWDVNERFAMPPLNCTRRRADPRATVDPGSWN